MNQKCRLDPKFRLDQKSEIGLYNEYLVSVSILYLSFYECHGYGDLLAIWAQKSVLPFNRTDAQKKFF